MTVQRSILGVFVACLFIASSFSYANAAGSIPFKTLRAATNSDGTFFVGGGGFTVSRGPMGHYHVAFPAGTWNNGATACFYVPVVQAIFTTATAEIAGWTTFGDGSGVVDIVVSSGADAPLMMVFTSANC
jgi:hypothetical protein